MSKHAMPDVFKILGYQGVIRLGSGPFLNVSDLLDWAGVKHNLPMYAFLSEAMVMR